MIRKKDLGPLDFIAKGAVGEVHRLTKFSLPGCPPLAYKEVMLGSLPAKTGAHAVNSMVKAVAFRAGLSQADRDDLDEYTTWPVDVVEDGGKPCGIVMPLIPPDFFTRTNPQSGSSKRIVLELSWLSATDVLVRRLGIDRSGFTDLPTRIALMAQLVYAVGRLHKLGVVYGDLSLKNAALALNPVRVKLLDCDATASLSDAHREQFHSPAFNPPEMSQGTLLQDDLTDVYKLGLCIIRGLSQGGGVTQARDPSLLVGKLDQQAVAVVARAVGADRSQRPTAGELFACLERNLLAMTTAPTLQAAWLDRDVALRGTDVRVHWQSTGAEEIVITGGNGLRATVADQGTPTGSHTVTPETSGEICVEVTNKYGSIRAVAGDVRLFELPAFHVELDGLPRPVVPGVPAVAIPPVLHELPAVPLVSTAGHPVPRPQLPPLDAVASALSSVGATPAPMQRVLGAVTRTPDPGQTGDWADLHAAPGPDLAAAATKTVHDVHEVLKNARKQIKDRVTADVAAALRQGNTRP